MWWLIGSMVMNAFSSYQQGKAMEAQHKQNELTARHNAMLARRQKAAKAIDVQEDQWYHLFTSQMALGTATVAAAASGAATFIGAPFMMRAQMASMLDWERYRLAKEGRAEMEDLEQEAQSYEMQARGERAAGKSSLWTGLFSAGSAILGGIGQGIQRNYWLQPKTTSKTAAQRSAMFSSGSRQTGTFRGL
jgi:hypothetical protein